MEIQKLSVRRSAIAMGGILGGAALVVGLWNLRHPGYGQVFLDTLASIYPIYAGSDGSPKSVLILTGMAFINGAVGGFVFALIYNFGKKKHHEHGHEHSGHAATEL